MEVICLRQMEAVLVEVCTLMDCFILGVVAITATICALRQILTLLRRPGTKCCHILLKHALLGHAPAHQCNVL
jgi:hypothetical protein